MTKIGDASKKDRDEAAAPSVTRNAVAASSQGGLTTANELAARIVRLLGSDALVETYGLRVARSLAASLVDQLRALAAMPLPVAGPGAENDATSPSADTGQEPNLR